MKYETERRRPRTQKKCPGCGVMKYIHADEICGDCVRKLADYDTLRAELAARKAEKTLYRAVVGNPKYFTRWGVASNGKSWQLAYDAQEAFGVLAESIGEPYRWQAGDQDEPIPHVFSDPAIVHALQNWERHSFMWLTPQQAAMIDQLDQTVRRLVEASYEDGKRDGASLLDQLAAGDVLPQKFNDLTIAGPRKPK